MVVVNVMEREGSVFLQKGCASVVSRAPCETVRCGGEKERFPANREDTQRDHPIDLKGK